jgi:hypothetical protein
MDVSDINTAIVKSNGDVVFPDGLVFNLPRRVCNYREGMSPEHICDVYRPPGMNVLVVLDSNEYVTVMVENDTDESDDEDDLESVGDPVYDSDSEVDDGDPVYDDEVENGNEIIEGNELEDEDDEPDDEIVDVLEVHQPEKKTRKRHRVILHTKYESDRIQTDGHVLFFSQITSVMSLDYGSYNIVNITIVNDYIIGLNYNRLLNKLCVRQKQATDVYEYSDGCLFHEIRFKTAFPIVLDHLGNAVFCSDSEPIRGHVRPSQQTRTVFGKFEGRPKSIIKSAKGGDRMISVWNGGTVFIESDRGCITVYDHNGTLLHDVVFTESICSMNVGFDGRVFVGTSSDSHVHVLDLNTGDFSEFQKTPEDVRVFSIEDSMVLM